MCIIDAQQIIMSIDIYQIYIDVYKVYQIILNVYIVIISLLQLKTTIYL